MDVPPRVEAARAPGGFSVDSSRKIGELRWPAGYASAVHGIDTVGHVVRARRYIIQQWKKHRGNEAGQRIDSTVGRFDAAASSAGDKTPVIALQFRGRE